MVTMALKARRAGLTTKRRLAMAQDQKPLVAMILPDHLEAKRRAPLDARAAERRAAQQRAAESSAKVDMRVPVYFDELAVGLRLAVYGEGDNLVQAMCVHNGHLHKHGAQGKIETGQ